MNYEIKELSCVDNTIKAHAPKSLQKSTHANIAIVIHLYYHDLWEKELQAYLSKIDIAYDLYITVPQGRSDEEILQLFHAQPNAHIYMTENRGRDVLPFLQIMKLIGVENYTYICKMHSKKTGDSALGNVWRKLLYYDLIGSNQTVEEIVNLFESDENIGVITGKNTILDSERYTYGNDDKISKLARDANIIYDKYYYFAAGTMFWTRSELLLPIVNLFEADKLAFEEESGQKDDTLAHAIERFFGIIAHAYDKQIVESPARYSKLDDTTLNALAALVLSQQYVGVDVFSSQKHKIEEQNRYIAYLEELAESMRMKNRIKNLYADKLLPLGQKLSKIPHKVYKLIHLLKHNPTLLKKVLYYAKRGEFGYLFNKIREKSSKNLHASDLLVEVRIEEYFTDALDKERYTLDNTPIDIIIPVYNGYEFLAPLFDSVEKNTSSPYRLIVINDASPDERVKPYLEQRLQKHPTALLIDHSENKGFLLSVNEAYTHTQGHFVLLNTDTEVPSFWLERLMYPILHRDNIASTTPFTNAGEIASFPHFIADNPIFDGLSVEALDSHFKAVNPDSFYTAVPTGVGFCMGVNATVAKEIGMFAEDTFGKGYGEENDWCQRAIKAGYTNLIVPNLFVYHKHGGSFSAEEKQKLLQKNIVTLNQRHPNYGADVNAYIEQNPHKTLRELLVLKASSAQIPLMLILDHSLGGGANIYTHEKIKKELEKNKNILLLNYDFYSHCFTLTHYYKNDVHRFKITPFEALKSFIRYFDINEIFINNLVSFKNPLEILSWIEELVQSSKAKLVVPIHDFYPLCPSYNLLNEKGVYCEVPSLETCKSCMSKNMQEWRNFYSGPEVDMLLWRKRWENILSLSSEILLFSHASKEIFLKAYPAIEDDKIKLIPHTVEGIIPLNLQKDPNKTTTTIGILGAIDYIKGSEIIKQMVQIIERDQLDIDVVVIGEISEPIKSKHFKVTGRYEREYLPAIIQEQQVDIFLIPSIWPETFSYTTQEIMMMELPLMVFNHGAPAERVKKYNKGYIVEEISAEAVLATITNTFLPHRQTSE